MKKLQRFTTAVVLTFMLAAVASAGDIWTGKAPPPTPAPATQPGEIPIDSVSSDAVGAVTLYLLQTALSVF